MWLNGRECKNCGSGLILLVRKTQHCFVCGWGLYPTPRFGHVTKLLPRINYELPDRASATTPEVLFCDGYAYEALTTRDMITPAEDTEATRQIRGIGR